MPRTIKLTPKQLVLLQLLSQAVGGTYRYLDPAQFIDQFDFSPSIETIRRWGAQLYKKHLVDRGDAQSAVYSCCCFGYKINKTGKEYLNEA